MAKTYTVEGGGGVDRMRVRANNLEYIYSFRRMDEAVVNTFSY